MRLTLLLLPLVLAGCSILPDIRSPFGPSGLRGTPQEVNGVTFRSRVSSASSDPRTFTVTTGRADRGPSLAAEAGRIEAVRYCLTRFGGSNIAWTAGPDRPPEALRPVDGTLVLQGRCLAR